MEGLRTQITDSQQVRSDLMKWKLILVAALGAAGLGINPAVTQYHYFLLSLIPFVCVYVDALCAHLSLRIKAIGEFLFAMVPKTESEVVEHDYERFIRLIPPRFRLETLALHWSSIFLSIIVGISGFLLTVIELENVSEKFVIVSSIIFAFSSITGIVLTFGIMQFHKRRIKAIEDSTQFFFPTIIEKDYSNNISEDNTKK